MNQRRATVRLCQRAAALRLGALCVCAAVAAPLPAAGQATQAERAAFALRRSPVAPGDAGASLLPAGGGDFPALPPDPYESQKTPLPPLQHELWNHGGSYLHVPEGDRLNWPQDGCGPPYELLRLPEDWVEPKPSTLFSEFLGADPIYTRPWLKWCGPGGYIWDQRFVGYGSFSLFSFALEQNGRRQDVIGGQLLLDLDLQLTGTERFHVQLRPLGRDGSGGSYYQFSAPSGYVDNSTGEPQRYWFEGELASMLGGYADPFAALDYNFAVGRFPFALHNNLLINDELLGVVLAKNNLYVGTLSQLNVQAFYAFNDVSAFNDADGRLYGVSAQADYRREFYELSYAFLEHDWDSRRDAHFAAFSRTAFCGPLSLAGRLLLKWGDSGGRGEGQLFVLESNYTRLFHPNSLGVESGVFYANAFLATDGWNSIAGGNFNRLRTAFETNPLVRIAAGLTPDDNWGVALGVQLFRCHQDESFIPEIAFESPQDEPVVGFGLRYLRKTGSRAYLEALLNFTLSDDPRFDREGVFATYHVLF